MYILIEKTTKHQAANVLNLWSVRQGLASSPILCNHSALEGASGSKQSYLAFNNWMFWDVSIIYITKPMFHELYYHLFSPYQPYHLPSSIPPEN